MQKMVVSLEQMQFAIFFMALCLHQLTKSGGIYVWVGRKLCIVYMCSVGTAYSVYTAELVIEHRQVNTTCPTPLFVSPVVISVLSPTVQRRQQGFLSSTDISWIVKSGDRKSSFKRTFTYVGRD
jgi:hypothetical protein